MTTMADAAWGADPGRWPLPPAGVVEDAWLRAVAAGGQGRYATALADLDGVSRTRGGPLPSLASSTRASFLRQQGWHTAARVMDGRALALAGSHPDACADAVVGLAADALGVGRFALSARLLDRAERIAGTSERVPIRQAWVSAELAMATGRGADAVEHARTAVSRAAAFGGVRHVVKSDVVLAAALCCDGALDDARRTAARALDASESFGLIPLSWALACLLENIGSESHSPDTIAQLRSRSAAVVEDRGGAWASR